MHVVFVTKRPKDIPVLRCRVKVVAPNRFTSVHGDVDVVGVHRTVGHMPVANVKRICEKAGTPWCDISTGAAAAISDIKRKTGFDLEPWMHRGFWKKSVGLDLLRRAAYKGGYQERTDWLNEELTEISGTKSRLTLKAISVAYRRHMPEAMVGAIATTPLVEVPPPKLDILTATEEGPPNPAAIQDFEGEISRLSKLMADAMVSELTIIAADDGNVAWNYKRKVIRLVDEVVEGGSA